MEKGTGNRKANSQFRPGSGRFTCGDCGRETRETGQGNAQHELCATCLDASMTYNSFQDGDCTEADYLMHVARIGYQGKDNPGGRLGA